MAAIAEIPEFMIQDCLELQAKIDSRYAQIEPVVRQQYPRILDLCRKELRDDDEAYNVTQNVFLKLFKKISGATVLGSKNVFRDPEAWLTSVARNECTDFKRERATRLYGERPQKEPTASTSRKLTFRHASELPVRKDEQGFIPDAIESAVESALSPPLHNPEERVLSQEIKMRYTAGLPRLTPFQRAAFILQKDILLQPDEVERLLGLDGEAAKRLRAEEFLNPKLRNKDVARVLGRNEGTVTSDLSRAKSALRKELADLYRRSGVVPVPAWPHSFLIGYSGRRGSVRSITLRLEGLQDFGIQRQGVSDRDRDFIRTLPRAHDGDVFCRLRQRQRATAYSTKDLVPGWFRPPEPDPEYLTIIRDLKKAKTSNQAIAKILNERGILTPYGSPWHFTTVELIARRARL